MQVVHSYSLTREQKDQLAKVITDLHAATFRTPRLCVNVRFVLAEPQGDFYVAGTPTEPASPNRILASVRIGFDRTKKMFDDLAETIERE
jgi:phenylpyruvate tautomerase PptA (4-oxalocrotonate tautomerase family)